MRRQPGNFLTNRHLNNDVFSLRALQPFKGESFRSLERDLHSNSSLKGLESPSNNSMIIGPRHSQWFLSKWTGEGGTRRKREDSEVYSRQFIARPPIRIQNIATFNHRACYLEPRRSPVKMDGRFVLIIRDEWRPTFAPKGEKKNAHLNAAAAAAAPPHCRPEKNTQREVRV